MSYLSGLDPTFSQLEKEHNKESSVFSVARLSHLLREGWYPPDSHNQCVASKKLVNHSQLNVMFLCREGTGMFPGLQRESTHQEGPTFLKGDLGVSCTHCLHAAAAVPARHSEGLC